MIDILGLGVGTPELSEESLEQLLIALHELRDRTGRPIATVPTHAIFTREALIRWFGWQEDDFK